MTPNAEKQTRKHDTEDERRSARIRHHIRKLEEINRHAYAPFRHTAAD